MTASQDDEARLVDKYAPNIADIAVRRTTEGAARAAALEASSIATPNTHGIGSITTPTPRDAARASLAHQRAALRDR